MAMADSSVRHLVQASLCSFSWVSMLRFVPQMYTLPQVIGTSQMTFFLYFEGIFDLSENATQGGPRLEHRSDVEVPTPSPDPLTIAC